MEKKQAAMQKRDAKVQRKMAGSNGDFTESEAMTIAEKLGWINVQKAGTTKDKITFENALFDK